MRRYRTVLALALIAAQGAVAAAGVIHVPGRHPTIAQALAAARSGDTILVARGVYRENITWPAVDGIRLVSVSGPTQTTIDGGQKGRVIEFGMGLSRATVLEGFTITNGYLNTATNDGAGLLVGSSPTIRGNVITGNVGDGATRNSGGGIFLSFFSNALIERNVISHNVLKNGSWNSGAGIYISVRSTPDIIGNQILNNVNTGGMWCHGGGIYTDGAKTTNIISNVIAGNTCSAGTWSFGGGIFVGLGAEPSIINNTIAGNACNTGTWQIGGGIEYEGTAQGRVLNNIITGNSAVGPGGIRVSQAAPIHDYNDVWNNGGGNYGGLTAGPHSISADPLFAGAANYHLTTRSPCVDAGSASALPATVVTDYDGDSRWLDGDLGGWTGNGARPDLGADELSHVRLALSGTPRIGTGVTFWINGLPGGAWALLYSGSTGVTFVNPYGLVLLGAPYGLLSVGVSPGTVPVSVPNVTALIGLDIHFQAGVSVAQGGPSVGNVTNRLDLMIY